MAYLMLLECLRGTVETPVMLWLGLQDLVLPSTSQVLIQPVNLVMVMAVHKAVRSFCLVC